MIRANASRYPISAQCRILGVPRSTYYWMIEHPEAERVDPIAGDVHAIWRDSHERYGARKIKAALERRGVTASRRRIVNIMKRRGMTSAYARRTFKPHKTRVNEARLANILDREFDGYEPRTHLASDLTYVRVGGKWAYVCLLIDLANRSIAGHSADTSRTVELRSMDGEPIVTLERRWGRSPDTAMDPLSLLAIIARKPRSWGESPIRSDFPEETRVLLDRMEPRERGLLVDDIRHAAVVSGFRAAVMAVVEIVAAGRRPDRAAIDQTARRIAQGDGPESRARLDTYSRFMREDGDE